MTAFFSGKTVILKKQCNATIILKDKYRYFESNYPFLLLFGKNDHKFIILVPRHLLVLRQALAVSQLGLLQLLGVLVLHRHLLFQELGVELGLVELEWIL
jgi:hypothetical protein